MKNSPILKTQTLPLSLSMETKPINVEKMRTLTVTVRGTYNASATATILINLYFSPDGENRDTVAYASTEITVAQGQTVQKTLIIDAPEKGYLSIEIKNQDTTYSVTDISIWITESRW